MNDERLRRRVIREATGTTVRHTSPTKIKSGFGVKPKWEEQDRIASLISAKDTRIAATVKTLAKLHSLKRGIAHDPLTGRVRIKL
jgi:type I restriction enzyme S subunit